MPNFERVGNENNLYDSTDQANQIDDQEEQLRQEQERQQALKLQRTIGSKVLSIANYESRHKEIVESSFNKARAKQEKLPSKNNERRNYAYLARLDQAIEKHGSAVEKRLWEASAANLILKPENIKESYWQQQEQLLRNEGHGQISLGEREKDALTKELIKPQVEALKSWTNYLSDDNCPYPTWFKVYAFDGLSKMTRHLTFLLDNTKSEINTQCLVSQV